MTIRRSKAFRPGTQANHVSQFKAYIEFCCKFHLQDINPSVETACLYVEYLAQKLHSPRTVKNYISAVRLMHRLLGIYPESFYSFQLTLMLRSVDLTMTQFSRRMQPINEQMLLEICQVCDSLHGLGHVLKFAFLLAFYAFLRQSNLAPPAAKTFDPSRHTCRGDIFLEDPGLHLLLKWTKTHQCQDRPIVIPIPEIKGHPLCPVRAYRNMLDAIPTRQANSPLLLGPGKTPSSGPRTLTARDLGRAFRAIIDALGYPAQQFSLHSLRRGGATCAHRAGVDHLQIKQHGTWRSDAYLCYITPSRDVPRILATHMSSIKL